MNLTNISKSLGIALFVSAFLPLSLFAREPDNIFIGAGVGGGYSSMSIEHSQIMRHPIENTGNSTLRWNPESNAYSDSWALAWEVLIGYKHFINEYVGLRYYADIGIQHYKTPETKQHIGIIDYTLNADLLLDFYSSESVAFGIFGGVGFGGASFDKKAVNQYMDIYNAKSGIPIGASDISKHFFNINAGVGIRLVIFQRRTITTSGFRSCSVDASGKRSCSSVSVGYIGHNFEAAAKFPLLTYEATTPDILLSTDGNSYISRPGYKIKNPYRFTFRYVIEF